MIAAAVDLLREIQARGATVRIDGNRLRVRPRSAVRDLETAILANADAIAEAIEGVRRASAESAKLETPEPVETPPTVVTWRSAYRSFRATVLESAGDWSRIDLHEIGLVLTVRTDRLRPVRPIEVAS